MNNHISELLKSALLSSDETGTIKICCESATESEELTQTLMALEAMGYLCRLSGTAYYRPFQLTPTGEALRQMLVRAEGLECDILKAR